MLIMHKNATNSFNKQNWN